MPRVYIGIGGNITPAHVIPAALGSLADRFGPAPLHCSPIYASPAVGFRGDPFWNLVCAFDTLESPDAVTEALHGIEAAHGRKRGAAHGNGPHTVARFGPRTLDLDLLLYGDVVRNDGPHSLPRTEIVQYAFVLKPLVDLAPDLRHPVSGITMATLWDEMAATQRDTLTYIAPTPNQGGQTSPLGQ